MSLSPCNLITNPSFETGFLSPWFTKVPNVATVTNATAAFDGEYSLALTTAINNDANSISQFLTGLTRRATYDFSAQVLIPYGADYCYVSAIMGLNTTIATASLEPSDEWTAVTGQYTALTTKDMLTISVGCNLPDTSDVWRVYIDEVVLEREGCLE
ncbi:carbohydrate binding domain protein [Aspergillus heteromorphus CBS 117.55]|uniref:Carbohydrate binding domain protein n=1 Tax=Aspergillus heteromorphus CBS 117.55 TaxID=1448321 RepID=A0A317WLB4_9EURO|nr:carbohydrate binding domain protein [Aspergillus heteromorphus CBS 117.55]PWY85010.1 carbohydrate binding domain protein [Aspergillus heteromorphus CBS 117.55]